MKFNELVYDAKILENAEEEYKILLSELADAKTFEKFDEAVNKIQEWAKNLRTMAALVEIRYKINTADKFYADEQKRVDKISPRIGNLDKEFFRTILDSQFLSKYEEEYGKNVFNKMRVLIRTKSPEVVELIEEENNLESEYSRLIGSAEVFFMNKKMTLGEVGSYFHSKDRKVRKSASEAYWKFFSDNGDKFELLYDKLVKVRTLIAKKLGYKNFIGLAYDRQKRVEFNEKIIKNFRENLVKNYLPFAQEVVKWQKENLGVEKLKYYDEYVFSEEELRPLGDADYIVKNVLEMFSEMADETKDFLQLMVENNMLDLLLRKGKAMGGFCEFVDGMKLPFIFMNIHGSSDDVTTLTHECGHAFADYSNCRKRFYAHSFYGYEIAEIHSMSMEFFSWPWTEKYFSNVNKFKSEHFAESILFIPYGLLVDEFQHWVYENYEASIDDRNKKWRELEKKYLPHRDYEDNKFLNNGGRWVRQLHFFEHPFYYIEYVIAQLCAFQYLLKSQKNFKKAWKEYMSLVSSLIDKDLIETLQAGNLQNPFEEESIKNIVEEIKALFNKIK